MVKIVYPEYIVETEKEEENVTSNAHYGLYTLLTLIFIVLKLCHKIDWSWWFIISPILIPIAFVTLIFVLIGREGIFDR